MKQRCEIPSEVNLGGLKYNVVLTTEGCVLFSEAQPFWGCFTRMMFWKSVEDVWQSSVTTSRGDDSVDPSRYTEAYRLVQEWFGANFSDVVVTK